MEGRIRTLSKEARSGLHAGITSSTAKMSSSLKQCRTPRVSRMRSAYRRGPLLKIMRRSPPSCAIRAMG